MSNLGDYQYILSDHTQQTLNVLKSPQILYRGQNSQKLRNEIQLNKIDILKKLDYEIEQSKYLFEQCKSKNHKNNRINNIMLEDQSNTKIKSNLFWQFQQSIKPEKQQVLNEQLNQILLNIEQLKQEMLHLKIKVNQLEQQDRNQIELQLNDLNIPKNQPYNYLKQGSKFQQTYFIQTKMQLLKQNSEKVLNKVQKISSIGSVALSPITIIGDAFKIINAALYYAIDENNVILFAVNPQKLEIEVQMAAISLGKQQQVNMKKRKETIFKNRVNDLLAKESSSSELFKNIYWICGTEDALIILSYLEKNYEKILKEQQKKLREIFEDAVKSYQYLPQNISVDIGCSSTCQMI
ncbi:unnamed protein product [Paramecium pentaurelia]|uniref:Uncharacterized protein n=1 Tax=Paramecium pentaurelia TaxID=43138 RepID=A0A8S1YM58_9CILI|nr:unnamed protein product [Paramecium pentaurelia]